MPSPSRAIRALIYVLLLLSVPTADAAETDAEPVAVLHAARSVINKVRMGTLITLDREGHPQARTMDPFPPEEDFTVWMGTKRGTRKVNQIHEDSRTTLHYFDPMGPSYVTLIGHAEIVEDRAERERHWKSDWEGFYEDGPRGEDYLLIRFRPVRLEIVSIEHGIAADPRSKRPAVFEFESEAPH